VPADFATHVSLRSRVRVARVEPGAPLVIALHGWGMTERAFGRWLQPGIDGRPLSWWLPRGILPCEVRKHRIGYAWYVFDGDQEALRASMDQARDYLAGLVDMARRHLRPPRITLLGFSQGGYLAAYTALSRPDLVDRCVVVCARPKAEFIEDLAAARGVRFLVQTGRSDASVTAELIEKGVAPMRAAGLDVEERSYDAEHRLVPGMATDAAEFAELAD